MEHHENVLNCSFYQVPPTLKISWKFVQQFFRSVANRQTDRQTDKAMDSDENITFVKAEVMTVGWKFGMVERNFLMIFLAFIYHTFCSHFGIGGRMTLLLAKIYNFWQVCSFVGLLLAKIYNFWQVCSFVGLLLAKISKKFASMFVCQFVCLSVC